LCECIRIARGEGSRAEIAQLAREVHGLDFYRDRQQDIHYKEDALRAGFNDFETFVPKELTDKLAYRPDRYNLITMVTSTFAHANLSHLIGNLIFFFIFASCVECALGVVNFSTAFLLMVIVTSLAYSHGVSASDASPAIGLSGVAMGMMALLTTLLPRARIWCFFWFLFFFRRFTLPVLVIAAWQIGWNIYELAHKDPLSHINYVAHVSGASPARLGASYRWIAAEAGRNRRRPEPTIAQTERVRARNCSRTQAAFGAGAETQVPPLARTIAPRASSRGRRCLRYGVSKRMAASPCRVAAPMPAPSP
jgi:membrane associated rhomboid family serine protease